MRISRSRVGTAYPQAIIIRSMRELYESFMDVGAFYWIEWKSVHHVGTVTITLQVERRFKFGRLPYDN